MLKTIFDRLNSQVPRWPLSWTSRCTFQKKSYVNCKVKQSHPQSCVLCEPSATFRSTNSPQPQRESHNSFVWPVLLEQSTVKFWFALRRYGWLNPRRGSLLEITAHPDGSTKAGGGEERNEKEILQQQQNNNFRRHKLIFMTLLHEHVKGYDLWSDDYPRVLEVAVAIMVSNN